MFDLDHYLVHSRRWLINYGLSEENLVGRSHYEVFSELPERWKELHQRSLARSIEKRKVYKWFGTSTDIHDIKESEKSLLEKERLLVDSQAIAHIGSLMVDINTRTIRWSEEIFRLYGLSSLTDNPPTLDQFFELLHPDDILRMQKCTNASVSGKQPNAFAFLIPRYRRHWSFVYSRYHGCARHLTKNTNCITKYRLTIKATQRMQNR